VRWLPRRLAHGEEATLVEHLGELRARIVISLVALVAAFTVTYTFHGDLVRWLSDPLPAGRRKLLTFSPAEPFVTSFMVSAYAAFLIALPVVLWQVWSFLAPAFQPRTQRVVAGFTTFAAALLCCGVAFGYVVVLPAAVHFLTNYDSSLYDIQIRARDYLSFASLVMLATGIVFEVPIVVLGLVRLHVVSAKKLRKNWRLGVVVMTALAVALPGVDPVTTTIEAVPLISLYLLSIWLAALFERRWQRQDVARAAAFEAGDW